VGLKIATTISLIISVGLLIAWNWAVGPQPASGAPKPELQAYGKRLATHFGLTTGAWLLTATLAMLTARQARYELLREAKKNIAELMEGSLRDHGSRDDAQGG